MWSDAVRATDILLRSRRPLLSFLLPFSSSRNNLFPCLPARRILVLPHNPLSRSAPFAHCTPSLSCPRPACCAPSLSCPRPACCAPSLSCPRPARCAPVSLYCPRCAPPARRRPCPVLVVRHPLAAALVQSATGSPPDPAPLHFVASAKLSQWRKNPRSLQEPRTAQEPPKSPRTPKLCPANHPKPRPNPPISRSHLPC